MPENVQNEIKKNLADPRQTVEPQTYEYSMGSLWAAIVWAGVVVLGTIVLARLLMLP